MSDSTDGTDKVPDDGVVTEFDQTNGVVQGLDGDDGGAENPDARHGSLLGDFVADPLDLETDRDRESGETNYSEEGRE